MASNQFNPGASTDKPQLSEAEQAWQSEYDQYSTKAKAMKDGLEMLAVNKMDKAPEANELKKEFLNTEYRQSLHFEVGYNNPLTSLHVSQKTPVEYREFPINGMSYSNDGQPPRPDISDSAVARKTWVLEKLQEAKQYFQGAKEGVEVTIEAAKPYAREVVRAAGAAAIDSIGPTPSKILPLPKTMHPPMDYLREGTVDEASGRAGIKTPGNAAMDQMLGSPPSAAKNRLDHPFETHSSIDESIQSNTQNKQMAEAFLYGNQQEAVKTFPALAGA